ncbi:MAG: lytic transglycosylase domain-containing protein [Verrucomicrobiota bacterium]
MIFPPGRLRLVFALTLAAFATARAAGATLPAQAPMDFTGRLRTLLAPPTAGTPVPFRPAASATVPDLSLWLERMQRSRPPSRAEHFLPVIRAAFAAQGVPESLVWLAETESSFNPTARSPVGALGLFQLMPATAASLGLFLYPLDQRTHPEASAVAAAIYLRHLHNRFGDWPLALAAYNAGEGAVRRALKTHGATDFAGIAPHLPAETRDYVPKVLATVQLRAGTLPSPPPGSAPAGGTKP